MGNFETALNKWLNDQINSEKNPRRRELLEKGLNHSTKMFLKKIWYPVIGNFNHLYAEWEVRDYGNRYRYLDLAYLPIGGKGCIELHDFSSHARDIEAWRFRDLCKKQAYLALDDWLFLPIAYLSIQEEPEAIKQMTLSFVGKFVTTSTNHAFNFVEEEALRFARGIIRPFSVDETALHLNRSIRQTRRILNKLVEMNVLTIHNGQQRYRMYKAVNNVR